MGRGHLDQEQLCRMLTGEVKDKEREGDEVVFSLGLIAALDR